MLSKVEGRVSPTDVISGGNRHMHALSSGLDYQDEHGRFAIETLDALSAMELERLLRQAYHLIFAELPKMKQAELKADTPRQPR